MASSSIYKSFKYDVFISFRGEDVRKTFVDHLYLALKQKSIQTYKDDEEIKQGNCISDELIGSIEDSKLYIIVFSTNYASSSWCLDELVKIMECHKTNEHTAYPVFYDVEPTEVRRQSGAIGEAFSKHDKENKNAAEKWRKAMTDAANLAGWILKNTADGHEAKFIQKVVEQISLDLRSINFRSDEKLVGMKTRINGVLSSLGTGFDHVHIMGITGMGGGGKTTLARAVYDQLSFRYKGKSFVEKLREVSEASPTGLKTLQNQILSDVFNDKSMTVSSVHEGIGMMKRMMPCKKVILVLDDVDHREQLKALAGETTWFKPGSIIIITTRDRQVLEYYEAKSIHDVQLLSHEDAMCLFRRYAFGKVIPNPGYNELSRQVVCYAAGLPLAIEVLGSFLCGKDELEWMDALLRLKTLPSQEILEILEISFSGLEKDYKEIFLNVACLLKGWSKADAVKALESCGYYARNGLRVLEQKSLITVDHYGCLSMHDHIEEMGRNIVRRSHPHKPYKHSRLWINKEVEDILANDLGTKAIRYTQFHSGKLSPEIVMKGLRKMNEVIFLDMSVRFINASKSDCSRQNRKFSIPRALRYMRWNHYPLSSLPNTFQGDNLVSLEMTYSRIVQLWEGGERKVLNKLRFLKVNYSMLRTLDLGLTPNVETLSLRGCNELVEVQMSAACLKLITADLRCSILMRTLDLRSAPNLELLDLDGCSDLVELHMPGRSLNLRSLKLSESKLRTLDIGQTPYLECLHITYCYDLEELHMTGGCQKLKYLIISGAKLRNLDLRLIPNLEKLDLSRCCNLVELHMATECLKQLVYLNLSGCLRYRHFVFHRANDASCSKNDSFCSKDKSVKVGPRATLHMIAASLHECPIHPGNNLPKLQFECFYKEDQPLLTRNLEMLISVGLCACTNLEMFSRSICGLQHLRELKLEGSILEAPKDLDQLECLERLDLSNTRIKELHDSICKLKHLESLKLSYCSLLEKLPEDLGRLQCLKNLPLSYTAIKILPDSICMLKNLESLELDQCLLLEKLPEDLGQLECLKKVALSSAKIKDIPDSICMLKQLKSLELKDCLLLEKLPEDLGRLECLENLDLSYCKLLRDIPDSICKMKYLKRLGLCNCIQLEKLPEELGRLECLESVDLKGTCMNHLPQSIYLLKGLRIVAPRGLLQSSVHTSKILTSEYETYCYVQGRQWQ